MIGMLEIDLCNGGRHTLTLLNPEQVREAEATRDGWQSAPGDGYYNLVDRSGVPVRVYVRDITDVRVVTV